MADIESSNFSETDSSNNQTPPAGFPSGTALPSQVAPIVRAVMGAIKRDWDHKGPTLTSGGTNTSTLTYSVAPAAYVQGQLFTYIVGNTNTGSTTLNVNSLGAKTIKLNGANLAGGELLAGAVVTVAYDGTNMQLLATSGAGAWTAYTPTITANSGTFTSVSATGRYRQVGKIVHVQITIAITTNGTAAGYVNASLPVNCSASGNYALIGRENNISGKALVGQIIGPTTPSTLTIYNYDSTYPGATGANIFLSGSYEAV